MDKVRWCGRCQDYTIQKYGGVQDYPYYKVELYTCIKMNPETNRPCDFTYSDNKIMKSDAPDNRRQD